MTVRVVTAPTIEPVSLTEMKLHLREDLTEQDTLISALIKAAREYAERYMGRALVTQTLELTLPYFRQCDDGSILLPYPRLQWVSSVKYIDTAGVLQTIDASLYQIDTYREPGRVKPAYGEYWPAVRTDYNAVQIRYVAGYAEIGSPSGVDAANAVPDTIKAWLKVRVAQLYEHREAVVTGTIVAPLPRDFVDGLLDPYKVDLLG